MMNKPNLRTVIEREGVELIDRGGRTVCLCPFHEEKTASFYIYEDHYHCYGCGAHGDVINFIQDHQGLTFKEALQYLGIDSNNKPKQIKEWQRLQAEKYFEQQAAESQLREEIQITEYLVTMIRATNRAAKSIKTIDDLEKWGAILYPVSIWEYQLQLLTRGNKKDRYSVCNEYRHFEFEPVERFFNDSLKL